MHQPPVITYLLATVAAFLVGAIPFSGLIARFALKSDLRQIADGNPGASNVTRAGGLRWGILALVLDLGKGALPAWLAFFAWQWRGLPLVAMALAPILGHAFSPFLRWRGGKALATTIGVWVGLTLGEGPLVMGLFFVLWQLLLTVDGWAVLLGLAGLLAHLLLNHPNPDLITVCVLNGVILAWTHRADLRRAPALRRWWQRRQP